MCVCVVCLLTWPIGYTLCLRGGGALDTSFSFIFLPFPSFSAALGQDQPI